jgi:hypothetical protein
MHCEHYYLMWQCDHCVPVPGLLCQTHFKKVLMMTGDANYVFFFFFSIILYLIIEEMYCMSVQLERESFKKRNVVCHYFLIWEIKFMYNNRVDVVIT